MQDYIIKSLTQAHNMVTQMMADPHLIQTIEHAAKELTRTLKQKGRIITCGNGGSMCDAMHFAEELSVCFRQKRPALSAIAISDVAHLTSAANDFGYEQVFARFIEANARKGDALLAISTSGKSPSIINAAIQARLEGVLVIGLTGRAICDLTPHTNILIHTPPANDTDRIQECHIKILHILIELIEHQLFGK